MMSDSNANDGTNKVSMLACMTGVSEEQARQACPLRTSTTASPSSSVSMSALTESPMETNSTRRDQTSTNFPGATTTAGPDAAQCYNDEHILTAQTATTSDNVAPSQASMEPIITATLVENNDEEMQQQLQAYEQQLERMCRERENAVIGEVIPPNNDEEAAVHHGFNGDMGPSIQEEEGHGWSSKRKKRIFAVVVVVLVIIGIVVGLVVSLPQDLIELLSSVSPDGGAALKTNSTSQNNALNWLSGNANLNSYSNEIKIQRYVLAKLYYSTKGDGWDNKNGWLSDADECTWWNRAQGPFCVDGAVTELDLNSNNILGTIPVELALLSHSLDYLWLYNNALTGTIPSEIGLLTNLNFWWLNTNKLSGTIPSEIGMMINLNWLSLYDNNLTGDFMCPDFIKNCRISCDSYENDACRSL